MKRAVNEFSCQHMTAPSQATFLLAGIHPMSVQLILSNFRTDVAGGLCHSEALTLPTSEKAVGIESLTWHLQRLVSRIKEN